MGNVALPTLIDGVTFSDLSVLTGLFDNQIQQSVLFQYSRVKSRALFLEKGDF